VEIGEVAWAPKRKRVCERLGISSHNPRILFQCYVSRATLSAKRVDLLIMQSRPLAPHPSLPSGLHLGIELCNFRAS
jgi:hypothetical protein